MQRRLQKIEAAYTALKIFLEDLVSSSRREIESGGLVQNNILSLMIQSNIGEQKFKMDDNELVGSHDLATELNACARLTSS